MSRTPEITAFPYPDYDKAAPLVASHAPEQRTHRGWTCGAPLRDEELEFDEASLVFAD